MRLIDADDCFTRLKPYSPEDENWYVTGGTLIRLIHNAIDNTPTIDPLDALGICRCKDCIYLWHDANNDLFCAYKYGLKYPKETDYCPYAKRTENNNV